MGVLVKVDELIVKLVEERRVNQREPRLVDLGYLKWLRKKPCCVCGKSPCDAAHIKFKSDAYGKRESGTMKPDDKWAVPLCRGCHTIQHGMNEQEFWRERRILVLMLAQKLYAEFGGDGGKVRHKQKPRVRSGPKRKIVARPFQKTKRKIRNRRKK